MAESEHLQMARKGTTEWNAWRAANPRIRPDLSDVNFEKDLRSGEGFYDLPYLSGYDFSGCNLNRIIARNSLFEGCRFDKSLLNFADVCFSTFHGCTFHGTSMRVTRIGSASFEECEFEGADLAYCTAQETSFAGSKILSSSLDHMRLVQADMSGVELCGTSVYGVSAWDLNLEGAVQQDLVIAPDYRLTVDSIEIAQFIYLLVQNRKVREIIDTIASKVVLILGRFSPPRKRVLDQIKTLLRVRGYVPILFDFEGPSSRDLTETVRTLAHLSRFVVADLTDPSSIPHELQAIVPDLPSVPVQPVIREGETPYGMFEHLERYPSVLPLREYAEATIEGVLHAAVTECEGRLGSGDRLAP
jgi:hypothetical protein